MIIGAQSISCGTAEIVVAGGQESMSQSVHAAHLRNGIKFGNSELKDTMITDGLTDAFNNIHMGITGAGKECCRLEIYYFFIARQSSGRFR